MIQCGYTTVVQYKTMMTVHNHTLCTTCIFKIHIHTASAKGGGSNSVSYHMVKTVWVSQA